MQEYEYEFADFIYYTPGDLDKEGGIWPIRAGRSIAKPNYKVGPKRIECYSFHFVKEGSVRISFDGKQMDLQKGDMFCLFPGRTYFYNIIPSETTLKLSWLALDGCRLRSLLELAGLMPERPYRLKLSASLALEAAELVIDKLASVERWSPAVAMELQGLVNMLIAALLSDTASTPATELAGWIHTCMEFMEIHATEGISVQQVADFAGVHRSYFSNMFANQVGMSPMKYLQMIRMEKAKRLLKETDATVTEIALSLGYPNLYSFTRAFKTYYKAPPLTIRTFGRS